MGGLDNADARILMKLARFAARISYFYFAGVPSRPPPREYMSNRTSCRGAAGGHCTAWCTTCRANLRSPDTRRQD